MSLSLWNKETFLEMPAFKPTRCSCSPQVAALSLERVYWIGQHKSHLTYRTIELEKRRRHNGESPTLISPWTTLPEFSVNHASLVVATRYTNTMVDGNDD